MHSGEGVEARSQIIIPAYVDADEGGEARSQGEDTRSCYVDITNPEKLYY